MTKKALTIIEEVIENGTVEDITLDNIEIKEISDDLRKKLEELKDLVCLSMNQCNLTSLANFPKLPGLVRLELMKNSFGGSDLKHLTSLSALQSLSLGNNNITSFKELEPLVKLTIVQLDLSDTPLAGEDNYRTKIFESFPKLQILDNKDAEGNEYEYTEEEEDDGEDDFDDDEDGDLEGSDDDLDGEDGGEDDEDGEEDDEDEEGDDDDEEDEDDSDEDPKSNGKKVKK